ncbi:MAG TPA: V-type ATPase 116kDa subunit family protein [Micromonosporaceae bacterium]
MPWRESIVPVAMTRVAVVAPVTSLRPALVRLADSGTVELDRVVPRSDLPVSEASRALQRLAAATAVEPRLAAQTPDLADLERSGRADLLAGEEQLTEHQANAVVRDEVAAWLGWTPTAALPQLNSRLGEVGAAAVTLLRPRGVDPPTAASAGPAHRAFAPLVDTYGTVPYADIDPTIVAGLAYAVMFGAMFGDVGHGALIVLGALLIRSGRLARLAALRPHWLFVAVSGTFAMLFGFAYGEFFGPTGVVPTGLVTPLEEPVTMLAAGVALGAILLGGAYAIGTVNRVREGGWALALYAPAGIAGSLLFISAGLGLAGWYWHLGWLGLAAAALALAGLTLAYTGLFVAAGGGGAGAVQAGVEAFDLVIRLGANVVSFARLAAFGLTHAVLGFIVWDATTALWGSGGAGALAAVGVFVIGNALAFTLEALVAAVQALRLEYYELFSRVFQVEGRPFRPWRVPLAADPVATGPAPESPSPESPSPGSPRPEEHR